MEPIYPPHLSRGDLIGLVSPASTMLDAARIERGVKYLEGRGYRVALGANISRVHGYLAGTDEERVSDLHAMFGTREVKAILCIRGGYGTPRLLHLLDYRLIARNPKILVGYSDITALQLALWRKTRLISFQGPMAGVDMADSMDEFTESLFWDLLTSTRKIGRIPLADSSITTLCPGKASGRLLGGNLALIVAQLGTAFQPDFTGSVLFLEDIDEEPYRVDRMMMHLRNAAILPKAAAVLAGQFTDCTPKDSSKPSLTVEQVMRETSAAVGIPFLSNLPFGHVPRKMTMPIGLSIRVDAGNQIVEYLQAAVR